jgi:Lon protease-like protein
MHPQFDLDEELRHFAGQAPVFPLPTVVCYPHVLFPLHVFEPRYRDMVADALAGDRFLAMALLKPGWESAYEKKTAAIHDTVCLCRIAADERLPDGRYALAVRGLSRARIVAEENSNLTYRVGQLDVCSDLYRDQPVIDRRHRQFELLSCFRELFPDIDMDHVFARAMDVDIPLGGLCDVLAHSIGLAPADAQRILEEVDVDLRSDLVLQHLRGNLRDARRRSPIQPFPPDFSRN